MKSKGFNFGIKRAILFLDCAICGSFYALAGAQLSHGENSAGVLMGVITLLVGIAMSLWIAMTVEKP
jgi:ABC-type uncharacterized transport system permease subunit